jgi:hypothetical protein
VLCSTVEQSRPVGPWSRLWGLSDRPHHSMGSFPVVGLVPQAPPYCCHMLLSHVMSVVCLAVCLVQGFDEAGVTLSQVT